MQLFARTFDKVFTLDVEDAITIGHLKELLSERSGVAGDEQVLSYGAQLLDQDAVLVGEYVPNCATIDLSSRLLGGKVHGSLARAGKVRGQTPKVDKQEKKKKKVGRARRRMQYNRRFVNVQMSGPGRKKGPNSNSA